MPLIDELLDTIRETEFKQLFFLQRLGWSSITKTSRLCSMARITPEEPTVFKPSTIFQAIVFGIIFMFISFCALKGLSFSGIQLVGGLLLVFVLLTGIYFLLNRLLLSNRLYYTITLTRQGIAFDDDFLSGPIYRKQPYFTYPQVKVEQITWCYYSGTTIMKNGT